MPDLMSDLSRIAAHIPCLEAAAADESAPPEVRARAAAMAQAARSAVGVSGAGRNDPERNETEGSDGD